MLGKDVHALDPPHRPVAPVAPFVGDHQGSDHAAVALGDEIASAIRIGEHRFDAAREDVALELQLLGLSCHGELKVDNGARVIGSCLSNVHAAMKAQSRALLCLVASAAMFGAMAFMAKISSARLSGPQVAMIRFIVGL